MAQKVNPISVRLRINRNSDSSWFSDYYYTSFLSQDIHFHHYFCSVKHSTRKQSNNPLARCVLHRYPKRNVVHWFTFISSHEHGFVLGRYTDQKQNKNQKLNARSPQMNSGIGQSLSSTLPSSMLSLLDDSLAPKRSTSYNSLNDLFDASAYTNALTGIYLRTMHNKQNERYDIQQMKTTHRTQQPSKTEIQPVSILASNSGARKAKQTQTALAKQTGLSFATRPKELSADLFCSKATEATGFQVKRKAVVCLNYAIMSYWFTLKTNHVFATVITSCGETTERALTVKYNKCEFQSSDKTAKPLFASNWTSGFMALQNLHFQPLLAHSRHHCLQNIQAVLYKQTNALAALVPVRIGSIYQSASLVAQDVCNKIEQKKSFRQTCRILFQQTESCQYIKGIRISCSGRLNGAEIAKTERRQYGETSLHVFSDQIDYAHAEAFTAYGTLGVKVWISYT